MQPVGLTLPNYSVASAWSFTITIGADYSLTGKLVEIELEDTDGTVGFRYRSGVDSQLSISGQVVTVAILPSTSSLDGLGNTLADILLEGAIVPFNIDFQPTASTVVELRLQGNLEVNLTHGLLCQ